MRQRLSFFSRFKIAKRSVVSTPFKFSNLEKYDDPNASLNPMEFIDSIVQKQNPRNREIEKKISTLELQLDQLTKGATSLELKDQLWRLYRDHHDLVPAERYIKDTIEMKKDIFGTISAEVAELYAALSEMLFDKFQLNDALEARLTSIETQKKLGTLDQDLVKEWIASGEIKKAMRDPTAHREFEHALKILEQNNLMNETYGQCLFNLGEMFFQESKWTEARDMFAKGVNFVSDPSLKVKLLLQLGNAHMYTGEMSEAEKIYREALATMRSGGSYDTAKIADTLYTMGVFYATKGTANLAEEFTLEAIRLFETDESKIVMIARCYMTLGTVYKETKPNKAIEMLKKALDTLEKYGIKSNDVAFIQCSLGEILDKSGNHVEAYNHFQKAFTGVVKNPQDPDRKTHVEANILLNLGMHFARLKDYTQADKYLLEAYEGYYDAYGDNQFTLDSAFVSYHIGLNCMNLKRWFDAIMFLEESRDSYLALDIEMKRVQEANNLIKIANQSNYDAKLALSKTTTDEIAKKKLEVEGLAFWEKTKKDLDEKNQLIAIRLRNSQYKDLSFE